MNVPLPFEAQQYGFVWLAILMFAVSAGLWAFFSKKDLL